MRVILPQESQSLDGGHEIIGAGQRLSKARERIPRARDEASHAIEHPGSRFWSALNPTNSDWPYGHSSASIQRRILMLPGDDEASVLTDGAYCQRRSDSYARGPIPAHAPLPRYSVSGCWANCRGKRRGGSALCAMDVLECASLGPRDMFSPVHLRRELQASPVKVFHAFSYRGRNRAGQFGRK